MFNTLATNHQSQTMWIILPFDFIFKVAIEGEGGGVQKFHEDDGGGKMRGD
jgi:hypothetical protein